MAYSRQRPIVNGIGPFGTLWGSSTAACKALRSPTRKAASIFLNFSYSAHRSELDFTVVTANVRCFVPNSLYSLVFLPILSVLRIVPGWRRGRQGFPRRAGQDRASEGR